jgi:hypothetical protein
MHVPLIAELWLQCRKPLRHLQMPWGDVAGTDGLDNEYGCSLNVRALVSRLKGPSYEAGTRLQAASGMQHLIGNLYHVLVRPISRISAGCALILTI